MCPFRSDTLRKNCEFRALEGAFFLFVPSLLVPLAEKGGEENMANKPRQYFSVKMPLQRPPFNAGGGTGLPSLPALKERCTTGLLTE